MNSIWSDSVNLPSFPRLEGDKKTDVLIIGGGMAGLLCAYKLKNAGVDYILAESGRLCGGVTKNTTAKITAQHGMIYDALIKNFGAEKALLYYKSNEAALNEYRELCRNIDCEFEEKDSIVYTVNDLKKAENELYALEKLGVDANFNEEIPLPIRIAGAVCIKNQAQFNPLKFAALLVKKLNVYENTKIIEVRDNKAITENGEITAEKIVVATHFPFINRFGLYPLKMYQERSYALALENGPQINGMYVDEEQKGMSFRNYKNYLLVGGGDHRTGKPGGNYNELRTFARLEFPSNREKFSWATQDCMTFDGVPYIGRYSKKLPNMFVATGFNKWGMTSSMVSASLICDMILEKPNDCESLFSPRRNFIKPKFFVHVGETAVNFLTISKKRCPHLGCALKWNSYEQTWDCPCHGSRFEKDGTLIDNPAEDNLGTADASGPA